MSSAKDVVSGMQKSHGADIATRGGEVKDIERLPTGLFPFDLAYGGGFPRGKMSIVYGPESSGKTNLFLLTIAMEQRLNPSSENVFVDVENSFDPKWAQKMGVDVEKLIVLHPSYAEQAIDMVDAMMDAEDVSIICVDSLAALIPINEQNSTAEKAQVGGASALIGKLIRKGVAKQAKRKQSNHYPTLLFVNQVRTKIGVMFGNPETMPGGNAHKFASGLTIRIYGKNLLDTAVSATMPILKETKSVAQKWKVPIVSVNCEYKMAMIPHKGLQPGKIDDWNTLSAYLRDMELLVKNGKKGWLLFGEEFKTLTACKEECYSNLEELNKVKQLVIDAMIEKVHGLPEEFNNGVES
ncbi:MAG: hypothetical protein GQ570_03520 [Helicobacteraceae bacterium]|nr:hypothetical protein [Helicobacteraceae bacterium]